MQALLNDANTRILQRPQVRATDGGKASFLVGSSIPYVSGSLSSVVNTGSVPYATTQFQQVNVGTQIEFQPHVNGSEEISMHIKVELSNVLQRISIAGVDQPVIGKQTDEADIRMKDGEVSMLGGLSDKEDSSTISGLPGVSNLPILGYIFGTKAKTNTDNQILIAMIPHIVRTADNTNTSDVGVFAGTERVIRVDRRPETSATPGVAPAMTVPPPAAASGTVVPPPAGTTASPLSPSPAVPVPPPATNNPATPTVTPQSVRRPVGPPNPVGSNPPPSSE